MKAPSLYQLPTSTRARRTAAGLGLLLTFGLLALTGLCAASSRLAFILGYPPSYGIPVLSTHLSPAPRVTLAASSLLLVFAIVRARRLALAALSGVTFSLLLAHYPVYSPTAYLRARDALLGSEFGPDLASAELWGLACASLAVLPALPYARSLFRLTRLGDLHGSSRFANKKDLLEAGFTLDSPNRPLAYSSGLPIGIFTDPLGRRSLVRLEGDSHVLLVAPPGAGKTTGLVIPCVQDLLGFLFVLDVKGEICQATAEHRRRLGSRIIRVNPSKDDDLYARYNPLDAIRPYPFDTQDVDLLVQQLIPEPGDGSDPFWRVSARNLIQALILHVLWGEPVKTLTRAYELLCSPEEVLETILRTPHDPDGSYTWSFNDQPTTTHPSVLTGLRSYLAMPPQTAGGVHAQAVSALSPYIDPILSYATEKSDFSFEDLLSADRPPATLYLELDPAQIRRLASHVRLLMAQLVSTVTHEMPSEQAPRHRTYLFFDEFPVFGKVRDIEIALGYLRGYGCQVIVVVQSFSQIEQAYGDRQSITPNCQVHVAFAPSDPKTAKALSERAGNMTVSVERSSVSSRGPLTDSRSHQNADLGRPLLTPDEVTRLGRQAVLVLRTGVFPALLTPAPYYKNPFRLQASQLPPPASLRDVVVTPWETKIAIRPAPLPKREREHARSLREFLR